jgi:hypothetical protein
VKTRLSIIVLALAVALMAASGASAKRMHSRTNVRAAHHSLVKQAQKSAYKGIARRAHRGDL